MTTSTASTLTLKSADVPEADLVELDVAAEEMGFARHPAVPQTPLGKFLAEIADRLRDGHDITVFFD